MVWYRSRAGIGATPGIDLNAATEADLRTLLMAGRKIDAIKVYRRLHGVDLKTAKEAVERLAAELPQRFADVSSWPQIVRFLTTHSLRPAAPRPSCTL